MRPVILATTIAAIIFSSAAIAQQPSQATASMPDFSGIWTRPYLGPDQPVPSPGPVRGRPGNPGRIVGDYSNPILKPEAAEAVKKQGEIESSGVIAPNPHSRCWPVTVPLLYLGTNMLLQMLQQPHQITFLYDEDYVVRRVRMNESHPPQVIPSWYGDSVGHYEGDTLIVDTVGVKVSPSSVLDRFGTPYTKALHVVERFRLIDYEAAKKAQELTLRTTGRPLDELPATRTPSRPPLLLGVGLPVDPDYKGNGLQLQITVEDEGVFTMPWSATVTYRRAWGEWPEVICAENIHEYYAGKDNAVPRADKPDF